jgi:hypothetical protein
MLVLSEAHASSWFVGFWGVWSVRLCRDGGAVRAPLRGFASEPLPSGEAMVLAFLGLGCG